MSKQIDNIIRVINTFAIIKFVIDNPDVDAGVQEILGYNAASDTTGANGVDTTYYILDSGIIVSIIYEDIYPGIADYSVTHTRAVSSDADDRHYAITECVASGAISALSTHTDIAQSVMQTLIDNGATIDVDSDTQLVLIYNTHTINLHHDAMRGDSRVITISRMVPITGPDPITRVINAATTAIESWRIVSDAQTTMQWSNAVGDKTESELQAMADKVITATRAANYHTTLANNRWARISDCKRSQIANHVDSLGSHAQVVTGTIESEQSDDAKASRAIAQMLAARAQTTDNPDHKDVAMEAEQTAMLNELTHDVINKGNESARLFNRSERAKTDASPNYESAYADFKRAESEWLNAEDRLQTVTDIFGLIDDPENHVI